MLFWQIENIARAAVDAPLSPKGGVDASLVTPPEDMSKTKLTQDEIYNAIRLGNLDFLVDSIKRGIIKDPEDLIHLEGGDTILHVAARYGQVRVLAHFAETIDSSLKNERGIITGGYTAEEVAAKYGNRAKKGPVEIRAGTNVSFKDRDEVIKTYKEAQGGIFSKPNSGIEEDEPVRKVVARPEEDPRPHMARIFVIAKMQAGPGRDAEFANLKQNISDKVLPSRGENLNIPSGTSGVYSSLKGPDGMNLDSAALYLRISQQIADDRKKINEEKAARNGAKDRFLFKAVQGTLTEKDVVNYLEGGGSLTDATSKKNQTGLKDAEYAGSNALHHAIRNGHMATVKMLLEGVEAKVKTVDKNGKAINEIFGMDFDKKSYGIFQECLAKNPNDTKYQEIQKYLEGPAIKTQLKPPAPSPSSAQTQTLATQVGVATVVGGRGP